MRVCILLERGRRFHRNWSGHSSADVAAHRPHPLAGGLSPSRRFGPNCILDPGVGNVANASGSIRRPMAATTLCPFFHRPLADQDLLLHGGCREPDSCRNPLDGPEEIPPSHHARGYSTHRIRRGMDRVWTIRFKSWSLDLAGRATGIGLQRRDELDTQSRGVGDCSRGIGAVSLRDNCIGNSREAKPARLGRWTYAGAI